MARRLLASFAACALALAACGGDDGSGSDTTTADTTGAAADTSAATETSAAAETTPPDTTVAADDGIKNVPEEFATIQEAVDAAAPGDLVLVAPGTYNEAVNVTTDEIVIRGVDRNTVILDGNFELDNGIRVLGASGVAVENMTAINYTSNGFFWTGVSGYRGSYLTVYRTGDYGVYAFDSVKGQLEHIYAAGSPDAGVYIGQCYPCDAVLDTVLSEHNGLGYSGTNSGGNLLIVNSVFRNNRAGIVPNSGSYELCYPQRETTIVGNLVHSNNQADTPAIDVAILAMGNGILSAGGILNVIERNLVFDHDKTGIGLVPFPEDGASDDLPTPEEWSVTCDIAKGQAPTAPEGGTILWDSHRNSVIGNVLEDNREGDIVVASVGTDLASLANCASGNTFTTSFPNKVEEVAPCDGTGTGNWADGVYNIGLWLTEQRPPSADWKTANLPPLEPQENMPDAATAPAAPATNVPFAVDLAAITVPSKPA